ncbi:hypothetical protein E2C01_073581 [Portunus trituberculatus]|uniref:Uncharacterized protein n=1 Tax=Portunus trituberculatus TaxID=210409 RepID=A0A5B7IAX2_PORTR|nr:hypothetical protein [Portunus trituberculatus]
MNKAPAKKRSAEAVSEEQTFTASSVDSQDICLAAGQPRETIIHVKKVKLPVGGAKKLCLSAVTDHMASLDLTRQTVNLHTPAADSAPTNLPSLSPGLQDAVITDAASRASLPQPDASCHRETFPEGRGKTLVHSAPQTTPVLGTAHEGRPYLTVNPRSAAYDMLVKEGFLGLTMTPADPDTL